MAQEKVFPKGIMVKNPSDKAPEWVKGSISINKVELIPWLNSQPDQWINLKINVSSKDGKMYLEVDTWKPTPKNEPVIKKDDIEEAKVIEDTGSPF
jgi:hypothetical protein